MDKMKKTAYYIAASAATLFCLACPEAGAQLPQGLSVEEDSREPQVTVQARDTTFVDGIDIEIANIDSLSNSYLDSLDLSKDIPINDYTMIGIQGGVGISQVSWNPTMQQRFRFVTAAKRKQLLVPRHGQGSVIMQNSTPDCEVTQVRHDLPQRSAVGFAVSVTEYCKCTDGRRGG